MARKRAQAKGRGFGFGSVSEDMRAAAISALRSAAREVLNDLSAAGPNWSGEFMDSWRVRTSGGQAAAKEGGEGGKYSLFNVPLLKTQGRDARGRFISVLPANGKKFQLVIQNTAPYASVAMDLAPGKFFYPGFDPQGQEQPRGERQGDIRGWLSGSGANRSTAPRDWYTTYVKGGSFGASFKKGVKAGFIRIKDK